MLRLDPEQIRKLLVYGQFGWIVVIWLGARYILRKKDPAFFRPRVPGEAPKPNVTARGPDLLAQARYKTPARPLRLEGIRLDGEPHEILGVRADATEAQIQTAYRELMKRYHPDRVGRPESREWQDAQGIAEALNRAKTELLSRFKRK